MRAVGELTTDENQEMTQIHANPVIWVPMLKISAGQAPA